MSISLSKTSIKWQTLFLGFVAVIVACLVIAAGSMFGVYSQWSESGKIAPHYFVQGEDIGGLKPDAARQRLQDRFGRLFVTMNAPGRDFRLSLSQLGGKLQYDDAVEHAHKYGRTGTLLANVWQFWFSTSQQKREVLPLRWDEDQMRQTLWTVAGIYHQKPQDAYLEVQENGIKIVSEQMGRTLDVESVMQTLQQKYFPGLSKVSVEQSIKEPRVNTAALQGQDIILGKYTTRFNPGIRGRTANVRLAAEAVQGKVLMPGDTFSFNASTGKRTTEKGYRVAHIFVKKPDKEKAEIVDGVGGGVCQVSSTLYNAVRRANDKAGDRIEIVERNHHSLPVSYVPDGLDATVAWPYKDFRFRNSYQFPIYLRTEINGSRLNISVWGRVPDAAAAQYTSAVEKKEPT